MDFLAALKAGKILVSDGAWGTELAKRGFSPGDCPELMNADSPDVVRSVAEGYAAAGSDIILTNTFGGSPYKLAKFGLEARTEELNEAGARLSKEAADGRALVFGSIGPTGEFLAPLGTVSEAEMTAAFARQVAGLAAGGVDGIVLETMTDLGEVLCALRAAKECSDLPVVCSMTFDRGGAGIRHHDGGHPRQRGGNGSKPKVRTLPDRTAAPASRT